MGKKVLFSFFVIVLACLSAAGQEKVPPQEIPTVAFCDLVKNPSLYEEKIVRVKASYYVQFEANVMSGSSCDHVSWVEFGRDIEKSTPQRLWKQFNVWAGEELTEKSNCRIYTRRKFLVTWIGLFEAAQPAVKTEEQTIMRKFGHMNLYDFNFTVRKIEEISNLQSTDLKVCK